jgi:ATP-dependent DNA helicase RecQ
MLGSAVEFRPGQWEALDLVANQRRRVLVVQRTGWGKSIVYFLAAKILREAGAGPALLVSPLLSLMRNQLLATERIGIRAAAVHSENTEEWQRIQTALQSDQVDLLMVSPERLGNREFLDQVLPLFGGRIGLFVVDEAHCISDWGHDFRPDYRRIVRLLRLLPPRVPVLCTTATANQRVVQDVQAQIPHLELVRGPLIRQSLKLFTIQLDDQAERLAWLAEFLPQLPGSGIVYTLTVADARRVANWLQQHGVAARAYHADLEAAERVQLEQQLLDNKVKALVATVALGMGFDKPDLGFVVHFQRPGSVVAYYQQVGRAGRAVDSAYGILLSGREDDEIQDYFIRTAFPPLEVLEAVLAALETRESLTLDELGAALNQSRGTLEKALKLLEVDGAVEREKSRLRRTMNRWTPDLLRAEQVTALRRAELEQMRHYVRHDGCLMEFLARALDDPSPARCGKCMNCAGQTRRRPPSADLVQAAAEFLRGDHLEFAPKQWWPRPLLDDLHAWKSAVVEPAARYGFQTTIPERFRAEIGRVLSVYGDAGWGREVAQGKYVTGTFSEALVEAAARLVRDRWKPEPKPEWVTAIPSLRHPELVAGFAERLARQLGLPFLTVLEQVRPTEPQKDMRNRVQQVRNLMGAFGLRRHPPKSAVLLVDDVLDSGWTLTLAAVTLRLHGAGRVHPLALAQASPKGT